MYSSPVVAIPRLLNSHSLIHFIVVSLDRNHIIVDAGKYPILRVNQQYIVSAIYM
jgi:hypothetical protein